MQALAIISLPTISMQVTSLPQKQGETCSLQSGTNLEQKRLFPSHFLSVLARSQPTIHFLVIMTSPWPSYCHPWAAEGVFPASFPSVKLQTPLLPAPFYWSLHVQWNCTKSQLFRKRKGKIKWLSGGLWRHLWLKRFSLFFFWHLTSLLALLGKVRLYLPFFSAHRAEMLRERNPATLCLCCLCSKQEIPASLAKIPARS